MHESTVLIFDEIFGSQDEERRNNLLTALRTQESRFPQILLISHIAEMQGVFESTLVFGYRLSRSKHPNNPRSIVAYALDAQVLLQDGWHVPPACHAPRCRNRHRFSACAAQC